MNEYMPAVGYIKGPIKEMYRGNPEEEYEMMENEMNNQENGREDSPAGAVPRSRRWDCGDNDNAWWEDRSLPAKIFMGIGFGILGVGFIIGLVFAVMTLWNWLMPEIFGLTRINFWKAAGIMALCFILFKSWGSGSGKRRSDWKPRRSPRKYMQAEFATGQEPADSPQS